MTKRFRRTVLVPVILAVMIPSAFGDSLFETSRGLPGYHAPGAWSGSFSLVNDAAGPDHVEEWDDARTAGYELFLRTPIHLYAEIAYSGYTKRSTSAAPDYMNRSDTLYAVLGGVWDWDIWGGRVHAMAGAGGLFFGNFLGYQAQGWLHEAMGLERDIPPESGYVDRDWTAVLTAEAGITAPGGWPVAAGLSFFGNTRGIMELEGSAGFVLESPFAATRIDAVYRFIDDGDTIISVSDYLTGSRGFWLEYEFRVHALYAKYSINPVGGLSQGSFGITFSTASRATPGALWKGGFLMDYSFSVPDAGFVNRIAWNPAGWNLGKSIFSFTGSLHSAGNGAMTPYVRFQKTLVGMEWSLPMGDKVVIEPFAGLSAGYAYRKTYDPLDSWYQATIASSEWMFLGRLDCGVRFSPVVLERDGRRLGYGMVAGVIVDGGFPTGNRVVADYYVGFSFFERPGS